MAGWRGEELEEIGSSDELRIASIGPGGALRKPTTIWVVRLGDDLLVRSVNGRAAAWFRGTQVHHEGRIPDGGVTREVTFVDAKGDLDDRSMTRTAQSIDATPRASPAAC
jgi:hypothetical protein